MFCPKKIAAQSEGFSDRTEAPYSIDCRNRSRTCRLLLCFRTSLEHFANIGESGSGHFVNKSEPISFL